MAAGVGSKNGTFVTRFNEAVSRTDTVAENRFNT
jgi:hypothetical protein